MRISALGKILILAAIAFTSPLALAAELLDIRILAPSKDGDSMIMNFAFETETDREGSLQKIRATIGAQSHVVDMNSLRAAPVALSYSGFSIIHLQNISLNAVGEGVVRVYVDPKFVGDASVAQFDVQLRRIGPQKTWAAIRNKKVLKVVSLTLSYNPVGTSAFTLLFSPPKVNAAQFAPFECHVFDAVAVMQRFSSVDILKAENCKIKVDGNSFTVTLAVVTGVAGNTYDSFYMKGIGPAVADKKLVDLLTGLESLGADFAAVAREFETNKDGLFRNPLLLVIEDGYKAGLEFLLSKGFRLLTSDMLDAAMANAFQYDSKKAAIVGSPRAKQIIDLVIASTGPKTSIANVLRESARRSHPESIYNNPALAKGKVAELKVQHARLLVQLCRSLGITADGNEAKVLTEVKLTKEQIQKVLE